MVSMKQLRMLALPFLAVNLIAAEGPFLITYTPQMEEPGNLEVENKSAVGTPAGNDRFWAGSTAFEYGVTGWWTTEIYVDNQYTAGQGGLFTGTRFENRFRMTRREHWINPVLYAEFENITAADKSLLEVVGHDGAGDLAELNQYTRRDYQHEAELKVILGSDFKGWNVSENFIFEKNLGHAPWEFGYSVGIARPLALEASPQPCNWCRENFTAGLELYGGLGDTDAFGIQNTSHYAAPVLAWRLQNGITLKVSPGFGLTDASLPFLMRVGVSYEIPQIARLFR
jgi:hypothetical protein